MPTLDTGPQIEDELIRLRDHFQQHHADLPQPIVLAWSDAPALMLDGDTPWLYVPAERDPLRTGSGRAVVPHAQRAALQQLVARGLRFRRMAVAHELDGRGPVRDLMPALRHGPRTCTDDVARALVGPLPEPPRARRAADALVTGAALTATGRVLDRLLDPIVLGVIAPTVPRHGEPSLFCPLVAWRW